MSDDMALFGDDPQVGPTPPADAPTPIADWQLNLIRKALDARGLEAMDDRQEAVQAAAGRAVPGLRDLTHDEAIRVLNRLGEAGLSGDRATSLWESATRTPGSIACDGVVAAQRRIRSVSQILSTVLARVLIPANSGWPSETN